MKSVRPLAILCLFLATLFMGTTIPIQKFPLEEINPTFYNILRFGLAFIFSLLFKGFGNFKQGSYLGIVLGIAYLLQMWGIKLSTGFLSGFLTSLYIPITPLTGFLLFRERLSWNQLFGVILIIWGIYFILGGKWHGLKIGEILLIISAFFFALHINLITYLTQKYEFEKLLTPQFLWVFLINLLFTRKFQFLEISLLHLGIVFYAAFLGTFIVILIQLKYQKHVGSTTTVIIFSLQPVISALTSKFILGEIITVNMIIGGGLIILAQILTIFLPR